MQTPSWQFALGQRWLSEAEPDLGLGLIIEIENRMLKVAFLACDEQRVYAQHSAPLARVMFRQGEQIQTGDGHSYTIVDLMAQDGLIIYRALDDQQQITDIIETRLAHDLPISQAPDRLFTHQIDTQNAFELRYHSRRQQAQLWQSPLRGLMAARIAPIAHQLYIAHEVGRRAAVRVLLADEVGLGKTIEAGLILQQLLLDERAKRVLIVVPPALISQWLLELMRRFNIYASLIDEHSIAALEEHANPFAEQPIGICSLPFLTQHPHVEEALAAEFDCLIVDEAHNLSYQEEKPSPEYQAIAQLAALAKSVLLLTATPEQLGLDGHFARLHLLDPHRFASLNLFRQQQQGLIEAASAVDSLLTNQTLDARAHQAIQALDPDAYTLEELQQPQYRQQQIRKLLDRNGTSRVLFRNSRRHIHGFPTRNVRSYLLPELTDKIQWLTDWLKTMRDKVLLITHQKETALMLEEHLYKHAGILCAAFHEDLSLLARDRAAAWFAEETGAQLLIASEIGSEGRNFQFAQHLLLFDLPENPDLLEQRIGRLDRIGQQQNIHIHVPICQHSKEAVWFALYHQGLNAFGAPCPAANAVLAELNQERQAALDHPQDASILQNLIQQCQQKLHHANQELARGHNRLLELGSFEPELGEKLAADLAAQPIEDLDDYLQLCCDVFGIDCDAHSDHTYILRTGSQYHGGFNDIGSEGTTFTLSRATAMSHEDYKFLTWEHPFMQTALAKATTSSIGNTAMATLHDSPFAAGTLLLECLFVIESIAPKALQVGRYLPPQLFRIVIDNQLGYQSKALPFAATAGKLQKIARQKRKQIIDSQKPLLENMLQHASHLANHNLAAITARALARLQEEMPAEIARLEYLQQQGSPVSDGEIAALKAQYQHSQTAINEAAMKLDAVRVLIAI